jgi:DNA-binding HxlR family transcriptional regulator
MAEEVLAMILGAGALLIISVTLKHWLRQREFQRRIESVIKRYDLNK